MNCLVDFQDNSKAVPMVAWYDQFTNEFIPVNPINRYNFTENLFNNELIEFNQDIFKKLNAIRSVTGEKLKQLLKDIFQNNPIEAGIFDRYDAYAVINNNAFPFLWYHTPTYISNAQLFSPTCLLNQNVPLTSSSAFGYYSSANHVGGEDLPSLFAHYHRASYVYSIQHIYEHLTTNEKSYWVPKLNPLCYYPYPFNLYAPVAMRGYRTFNYYRNKLCVGLSCLIHRPNGDLNVFFTLMKHTKNSVVRWLPQYPGKIGLFFLDELQNPWPDDVLFLPDETSAYAELIATQQNKTVKLSQTSFPMPLACPGGLKRLLIVDVSATSGKHVHIALPENMQFDNNFHQQLINRFSKVKAKSISFYHAHRTNESPFKTKELSSNQDKISCKYPFKITKPGENIPGYDIVRKQVLSPLIESGQLIWIYGPEKSGKSWFAQCMAHVISYGESFLGKYKACSGLKVLYVDSEMAPDKLQRAFDRELNGFCFSSGVKFSVKSARASDNQTGEINLFDKEWQQNFDDILPEYDVIFLDCYYSLTESSIFPKQLLHWIAPWKTNGKTFIIIDHTNKEDELQGGSDKKRTADLCIEIKPKNNQCIEVSFPTIRHLSPEDTKPFTLRMIFEEKLFRFELEEDELNPVPSLNLAECRKALAYVWSKVKKFKQCDLCKPMSCSNSSVSAWAKEVESMLADKKFLTRPTSLLEQIKRYENFTQEELIDEACRLARE